MKIRLLLAAIITISLQETVFAQETGRDVFSENTVREVGPSEKSRDTVFSLNSWVMVGGGCNKLKDTDHRAYGLTQFAMDGSSWTFDFGMRTAPDILDFTGKLVFYPLLFRHVRIGLGGLYNLNFFKRDIMTNDAMLGGSLELKLEKWFSMRVDFAYLLKFKTKYGKKEITTMEHFCCANAIVCLDFPKNFGLDLGFGSCQMFRYSDFSVMNLSLDFHYTLKDHWRFILGGVVSLDSCFTDSVNVSDADLGLMVKYLF